TSTSLGLCSAGSKSKSLSTISLAPISTVPSLFPLQTSALPRAKPRDQQTEERGCRCDQGQHPEDLPPAAGIGEVLRRLRRRPNASIPRGIGFRPPKRPPRLVLRLRENLRENGHRRPAVTKAVHAHVMLPREALVGNVIEPPAFFDPALRRGDREGECLEM